MIVKHIIIHTYIEGGRISKGSILHSTLELVCSCAHGVPSACFWQNGVC